MTWHKTPDMRWEDLTQQQWKWAIQDLLQESDTALKRAIIHIYNRQEFDEQRSHSSIYLNSAGFNNKDAKIMTSVAEHLLATGTLTPLQMQIARDRMPKYWRQLMIISKANLDIEDKLCTPFSRYDVFNDNGDMILRYCKVCKTTQPISNFYSTHSTKNGRTYYLRACKKCTAKRRKEEREIGRTPELPTEKYTAPAQKDTCQRLGYISQDVYENGEMVERYCKICGRILPIEYFYYSRNALGVLSYRRVCKYCLAAKRAEEREAKKTEGSILC